MISAQEKTFVVLKTMPCCTMTVKLCVCYSVNFMLQQLYMCEIISINLYNIRRLYNYVAEVKYVRLIDRGVVILHFLLRALWSPELS